MPFDASPTTATGANYREYFAELCRELPPVPDEDPEARAARQNSAMDAVVALHPDNAFEARLAVRIVSTDAHAADALRSAALAAGDPERVRQCRAQVASMARQSDAALRALLRIQATREKQEAAMHPAAMERAGYWFQEISVPARDQTPAAAKSAAAQSAEAQSDGEPEPTQAGIDAEAELNARSTPIVPRASAKRAACRPASTSARPSPRSSRHSSAAPVSLGAQPRKSPDVTGTFSCQAT
jgi:hypothetical protein